MKVIIAQSVLKEALEKGASASLSEVAQGDTSNLSQLVQSVKITAEKDKLVFESATSLFGVKYTLPFSPNDKDIVVKETGVIFLWAKQLYGWVEKQNGLRIMLNLKKLDSPETIKTVDDDSAEAARFNIRKIGTVEITSKDNKKTGSDWKLDCFDPEQASLVNFDSKGNKMFNVSPDQLSLAVKSISMASSPKDHEHIYDSIMFEGYKNELYSSTSDKTRCAIYKMSQCTEVASNLLDGTFRILIPCDFVSTVSKLCSSEKTLEFYYDDNKNKVFVVQPNFECRVTIPDKSQFTKFPAISLLLAKTYDNLCSVRKDALTSRLQTVSMVNKSTVLFKFENDTVIIKAISDSGVAPSTSSASVDGLKKQLRVVLSVTHLMDVMKTVKDEDITFLSPDNGKSVKITSVLDPNFLYYIMTIDVPKYANE